MAKTVKKQELNASTKDILNVIRENASYEYQTQVPQMRTAEDLPAIGQAITENTAFANQFINSLMNRIAFVAVKSATFNNPYADLKKGYFEFGETIEEVFVEIAKAQEFDVSKTSERELKRTIPDVKTAFHIINWRVQYPVTIEDKELRTAFLSMDGVQDLIAKIVDSLTQGNNYDEFLLFKYLLIKAVTKGEMYNVPISKDIKKAAPKFRGVSNKLTFMSNKYNKAHVKTITPKEDQHIFMDAMYNAEYDVDVLASAFNMDKADFMGRLRLIDDFTTFDNDAFKEIIKNSDQIEEVTEEELKAMAKVKAILVDKEFFQVYDNLINFTEKYAASGMYWNYFLNVWKTVSTSPFSNAVVFTEED